MKQGILRRAGVAVFLSALGNWVGMLGGLASLVIIARMVAPADYGLFGMVLVTLAVPEILTSGSLNESLIQRNELKPGHINSVLAQSLIFSLILWGIIQLAAPLIAGMFQQPQLVAMIRLYSYVLFLAAFASVPFALLLRDLKYREITTIDIVGTFVALGVGITLAYYLRNAWALLYMELARRVVRLVMVMFLTKWRPSLTFTRQDVRDLARFNSLNIAVKLVNRVQQSIPSALIGGFLGAAPLGMFSISNRLLDQAQAALITPFSSVSMPVAAQSKDNMPLLHRAIGGAIRLSSLIAFPTFLGGVAVAPLGVPFLLGQQWHAAIPLIQIILIGGISAPSIALNSGILLGLGRPDESLKLISLTCLSAAILISLAIPFGLMAVIWATLVQQLLFWLLSAFFVKRVTGFSMVRYFSSSMSALVASTVMALVVWATRLCLPVDWPDLTKLAILVVVGVPVYGIAFACVGPRLAKRVFQALVLFAQGRSANAIALLRNST